MLCEISQKEKDRYALIHRWKLRNKEGKRQGEVLAMIYCSRSKNSKKGRWEGLERGLETQCPMDQEDDKLVEAVVCWQLLWGDETLYT